MTVHNSANMSFILVDVMFWSVTFAFMTKCNYLTDQTSLDHGLEGMNHTESKSNVSSLHVTAMGKKTDSSINNFAKKLP